MRREALNDTYPDAGSQPAWSAKSDDQDEADPEGRRDEQRRHAALNE